MVDMLYERESFTEFDIHSFCSIYSRNSGWNSKRLLKFYTEEFVHSNCYSLRKTNYAVLALQLLFGNSFKLVNPNDKENAWHLAIELSYLIYNTLE